MLVCLFVSQGRGSGFQHHLPTESLFQRFQSWNSRHLTLILTLQGISHRQTFQGCCLFYKTLPSLSKKAMAPHSSTLPGNSHGWRSLVGCSPWGHEQSDTTERLHFHFSLSCIGEGTGNPLQCSCLENPRDGGSWWAAIHGVVQSRTWLKRFSSSSSPSLCFLYILPCWFLICLFMLPLMWTFKPKSSLQSFTCLTNGSSPLMALIIMS